MKGLYDLFLASTGVSTDSRSVRRGEIFFALHGDHFDGNRYAADALDRGAAWVVVDDPRVAIDDRYLVVDNTLTALQRLAAHHRRALGAPVLAITGTNGKTTTKELTARVLARKFALAVTQGNLNNHIGVPLTLLSMTRDTQLVVVEMGAGAGGEIRALCDIAAPDYGIITNVGRAHLEGFGSPEGVRRGKGELYDYLAAYGGTAFVPAADPVLREMAAARPGLTVVEYTPDAADGIRSPLEGDYNRANIAAGAAIGRHFGIAPGEIRDAVESYVPDNNRSQRLTTDRNTLILDCYNANPSSMEAAIGNFGREVLPMPKALVIGDMLELGAHSATAHEQILAIAVNSGIPEIYLVGANFTQALRDLPDTGSAVRIDSFPDVAALIQYLAVNPVSGRFILLKGSRGIALEKLAGLL